MKIGGQRVPGKTLMLMASEAALLAFGLMIATALRFNNIDSFRQEVSQPGSLIRYAIVVVVSGLSLYYYDLYDLQIVLVVPCCSCDCSRHWAEPAFSWRSSTTGTRT